MVASVVQSSSANSTGTATPSLALGATPTVGNTLLAIMSSDTTASAVPNAGTSKPYTQRVGQVDSQGFYLWTRLVVSGDSATTTFAITGANPATFVLVEIQGTYDKVATPVSVNTNTAAANRSTPTLTPATADGLTVAVAGIHNPSVVISGISVDNGFTTLLNQPNSAAGATLSAVLTAYKITNSVTATGTTTFSWSGNANDRDGIQIAFTGIGGAAAVMPDVTMSPIRR